MASTPRTEDTSTTDPRIESAPGLPLAELAAVETLLATATTADGAPPLNEAARLHLRHPRPGVSHHEVWSGEALVAYGQLEEGDRADTGQLVVAPDRRRRGIGTMLLSHLVEVSPHPLRVWALGDTPAAQAVAARTGLAARRTLLVMRRSLDDALPEAPVPPGVTLRPFLPGQDEVAWLGLNARAFAGHPEQGAMTLGDLRERMAEPWFDPAGFLLAEEEQQLQGFHWTKVHDERLGEVYVIGVDPAAGNRGLGKALLAAGLRHLRARGLAEVQLYVEADHDRAVGLYRSYGFLPVSRDVMYAQD